MAAPTSSSPTGFGSSIVLAVNALRTWSRRQVLAAITAAVVVGLVIGLATVLIPNPVFGREIAPVWWNYPVWLLTSALSGVLAATYVRPEAGSDTDDSLPLGGAKEERRTSRMGMAGGVLAWFAVGCPVCNKLALLALGYSGAITWFAPVQPFLAVAALALTAFAVIWRLRGQVACPVSPSPAAVMVGQVSRTSPPPER